MFTPTMDDGDMVTETVAMYVDGVCTWPSYLLLFTHEMTQVR
jgi:hypothetical protein